MTILNVLKTEINVFLLNDLQNCTNVNNIFNPFLVGASGNDSLEVIENRL